MSDPTQPNPAPEPGLTPPTASWPGQPHGQVPGQPSAGAAQPPYAAPAYQPPAYPAAGYGAPGQPPAPGAPYGYGAPAGHPSPYGYVGVRTNPLAVTSMVASIVGFALAWTWVLALGVIVGVITGHIALGQIARTREKGRGMALAGVIIGWVGIGIGVLILVAVLFVAGLGAAGSARFGA